MPSRTDQIPAGNGAHFSSFVSLPLQPNGCAVIVVQEIFGVTPHICEVADRFAREGYLAIAPDLFWRIEPGLSLSHSKEDMQKAFTTLAQFDEDLGVKDIGRALDHAMAQPGIKVTAVIGMCLGGKLAYLAAARLDTGACVAFYGVGIEKNLSEAAALKSPLLMFFGGKDKYAPAPVREQIAIATTGNSGVQMQVYDDADHGFYTRGDPQLIATAHTKVLNFLHQQLQGHKAAA